MTVAGQRFGLGMLACLLLASSGWAQDNKDALFWAADPDGGKPYVFKDPENPDRLIGFEVDIKDALARELGRPIKDEFCNFKELVERLERGDFDFAMNGLEITPDRLQRVRFTRPYYLYQQQLVVRAGDKRFKTLEEARDLRLTIGTLENTAAERLLKRMDMRVKAYEDQDNLYKDLSIDREIQGVLL